MSKPTLTDQPDDRDSEETVWRLQSTMDRAQVPVCEWHSTCGSLVAFTAAPCSDPATLIPSWVVRMLQALPDQNGLVASTNRDTEVRSWVGLVDGDRLAALVLPPPVQGPLIIRSDLLKSVGGLRSVDAPIWDWLIRASQVDCSIQRNGEWVAPTTAELPRLAPSRPGDSRDWLLEHLKAFEPRRSDGNAPDRIAATAFRAGLFLWNDYLDESHALAQSIEGEGPERLGDYWHAILHRREPDYSNAKYWFRQIGPHFLYRRLRPLADSIIAECPARDAGEWRARLQPRLAWDPMAFVDLCQKCAQDEESALALAARRIQLAEMALLLTSSITR